MDSITVVETLRDTVVVIERDSSLIRALVECDSLGQAHFKELIEIRSGRDVTPPKLELKDNILTATAAVDSMAIYLTLKDRYTEHKQVETITVTNTIETNYLTRWQKWMYNLGCIALGVLVCLVGFAIFKIFKPI
ncbi:MAG: hypothetical protein SNG79_01375 [Rikenellaceae bacterium]